MILGAGTISNYGSYINNCQAGQMPYKVPVNNLQDVQLFINIGGRPDSAQYQLIHTCGPFAGTIETLTTSSYVVGQDTNQSWYGVWKDFDNTANPLSCFVIAITLDFTVTTQIYFSDEYCIEPDCKPLTLIRGCYGNLDNLISYDCNGVYFGQHAGEEESMGDETIVYNHQLLLRGVEVTLTSIKNTFKQGRTRNFRTEKEKIFQFWSEAVPEWYLPEIDAIFYRGEVFIGGTRYLVNETQFEKIEDCKRIWKPWATLKESCYQSFSCEVDPCLPPQPPSEVVCCDPLGVSASVSVLEDESGEDPTSTINWSFSESGGDGSLSILVNSVIIVAATSDDSGSFPVAAGDIIDIVIAGGVGTNRALDVQNATTATSMYSVSGPANDGFNFTVDPATAYIIIGAIS